MQTSCTLEVVRSDAAVRKGLRLRLVHDLRAHALLSSDSVPSAPARSGAGEALASGNHGTSARLRIVRRARQAANGRVSPAGYFRDDKNDQKIGAARASWRSWSLPAVGHHTTGVPSPQPAYSTHGGDAVAVDEGGAAQPLRFK
jgi:hypothetical protein